MKDKKDKKMKCETLEKKISYWDLFLTFFKLGSTTFGGGYAMVPMIQREIVEGKQWIDEREFLDSIAVTNSLPGPLATNCAVYTGYRLKGYLGALTTLAGVIAPSLIIILLLAIFLSNFDKNVYVIKAFSGLRPAVAGLIGYSLIKMAKANGFTPFNIIMASLIFITVCFLKLNPLWAILASAFIGLLLSRYTTIRKGEAK